MSFQKLPAAAFWRRHYIAMDDIPDNHSWYEYRKTEAYKQMHSKFLRMRLNDKIELAELLRNRLLLIRAWREENR